MTNNICMMIFVPFLLHIAARSLPSVLKSVFGDEILHIFLTKTRSFHSSKWFPPESPANHQADNAVNRAYLNVIEFTAVCLLWNRSIRIYQLNHMSYIWTALLLSDSNGQIFFHNVFILTYSCNDKPPQSQFPVGRECVSWKHIPI